MSAWLTRLKLQVWKDATSQEQASESFSCVSFLRTRHMWHANNKVNYDDKKKKTSLASYIYVPCMCISLSHVHTVPQKRPCLSPWVAGRPAGLSTIVTLSMLFLATFFDQMARRSYPFCSARSNGLRISLILWLLNHVDTKQWTRPKLKVEKKWMFLELIGRCVCVAKQMTWESYLICLQRHAGASSCFCGCVWLIHLGYYLQASRRNNELTDRWKEEKRRILGTLGNSWRW